MDGARKMGWLVGALALLNLILIGFLLWPQLSRKHPPGPPDQNLNREADLFMERQIGMTSDQVAAFEKARRETKAEFDNVRERLREIRQRLILSLFEAPADPAVTEWLLDGMASCSRRLEGITYEHLRDIYNLCNPEQKERLRLLLEEVFRKSEQMKPPPPPPGGRP